MVLRHEVLRPGVILVGAGLLSAGLLSACGSSGGSSPAASSAVKSACQEVGAVLSDGPTPKADPAGYAEAQVLPLQKIHTSDKALQKAIDDLTTAYQRFYDTNGAGTTLTRAVSSASHRVDAICPGAAT